ncbi:MAG: CCA tRNA nucleotidyltransferase [Thermoprotei archaeon]|nr:MAG: CCA tRNA nucleotidyltransferase [Thermoprotei archaeon]
MNKVEEEVLRKIKPKPYEVEKIERIFSYVKEKLENKIKEYGIEAYVELEGSIAKDTWLSGEWDLDIFVLYPKRLGKLWVKNEGFKIIFEALKDMSHEIAYAEHPYIRLNVENVEVDVVPALKHDYAWEAETVVDRTPFHTAYIRSKLGEEERDQVRLLKRFLKGIGVYGAEIKVSGFSGYLTELLIVQYKTFRNTLAHVAKDWRTGFVIDVEKHYSSIREVKEKFKEHPLIVIDPVDPNRNVAAAVSEKSFSTFIAASKYYLRMPSLNFFYPQIGEVTIKDVMKEISSRDTDILCLTLPIPKKPSDVIWGLLRRNLVNTVNVLKKFDFKIVDYDVWCDEEKQAVFIIELEKAVLGSTVKSIGPPVFLEPDATYFLKKYLESKETIAGPWIENSRWVVLKKRKYREAKELLLNRLVSQCLSSVLKEYIEEHGFEIYVNNEIRKYVEKLGSKDFIVFLTKFLRKKPLWLK